MGTFAQRTRHLESQVGSGKLTASLRVHQPYAADEHNKAWYNHPRGGRHFYVQDPLFANLVKFLHMLGRNAVTPDGSQLKQAMIDIAKELESFVRTEAPVEYNILRQSGSVKVTDGGRTIYTIPQRAAFRWDKTEGGS